ncbi:hypothetical protein J1N35_038623 [Gossypium stocksii]|uniref:RNase H type-1 domain-containing protein n=1 Tax=Gossypium stocksii TaxID=47602 RepID=A0A9D3ZMS3_9ROSI|nr:hypothetical protein J1N35_038623 [Gossypium stocksii]
MRGNERRFCMQCVTAIFRKECGDPLSREEGYFEDRMVDGYLGFSMKVGGSDIFQVEARAIYEGLKLAWSRGFSRIEVDYDNAILIICKGFAAESRVPELRLIHSLCRKNWRVVFKHSSSEYNRVVDGLAKAAKGDYNQLQIFEFPPYYIRWFLEKDNQVMLGNFPALQSAAN